MYYLQSRYYDPVIGRFINADGMFSTEQGLLGNNMFAYCGNNPVLRVDNTGAFWSIVPTILVAAVVVVAVVAMVREACIQKNLENNTAIDDNPETTTENKPVYDQNGDIGCSFKYGLYDAEWNACETIAIHNAKVLLGMDSKLSTTMWDCQQAGIMLGCGLLGSLPTGIGKVLENYGIDYSRIGINEMTRSGVYIVSYWTGTPYLSPLHTIAIMYDGGQYIPYNYRNKIFNPADHTDNFICGYYLGG